MAKVHNLRMIQRILTALLGIGLFIIAFFVTSVLVAVVLALGLLTWTWLWWRARHQPVRAVHPAHGRVIEGEYRIVERK